MIDQCALADLLARLEKLLRASLGVASHSNSIIHVRRPPLPLKGALNAHCYIVLGLRVLVQRTDRLVIFSFAAAWSQTLRYS